MSRKDILIGLVGALVLAVALIIFTMPKAVSESPLDQTLTNPPSGTEASSAADNAPSTNTSPSAGLQIEDSVVGTGAEATPGSTVTVNYTGTLADGTKFDSSYDRNQPFSFQLGSNQVIKGWDQGVVGMKVGGKRHLTIPPELGYGPQAQGDKIPANSTLEFDIELLDVK